MSVITIPFDSELYKEELQLRDKIMRKPIGLSLFDDDLSKESTFHHFGVLDPETGRLIGCAIIMELPDKVIKLRQMAIDDSFQKKGFGSALIKHCIAFGRENGFVRLNCNARKTAIGFYEKLGFELIEGDFLEVGIPHQAMFFNL